MKIACLQMDVIPSQPEQNYAHAAQLIGQAIVEKPDVLVLPEAWDNSFLPKDASPAHWNQDCRQVRETIGALAEKYHVNIVAGSVTNQRDGKLYNTACVFDRQGKQVAAYDKIHLFSPANEQLRYQRGNKPCVFCLDGVRCGVIICYDLRFPELTRAMALECLDILFVVCQWPGSRTDAMQNLAVARAIENQMYVACCNACGAAGEAVCDGDSVIVDPQGNILAQAEKAGTIITADCPTEQLAGIRNAIPVFRDRQPDSYKLK